MVHEVVGKDSTGQAAPVWWDQYEVMLWIAFRGVPVPSISYPSGWGFLPNPDTLDALADRAEGRTYRPDWKQHLDPGRFRYGEGGKELDRTAVRNVWGEAHGRAYEKRAELRRLMRVWTAAGKPMDELPKFARGCAETVREREAKLSAARLDLLSAVRDGRLPIYGQPPARDQDGDPTFDPAGRHDLVAAEVFADPKLILHADAVTVRPGSRAWYDDRFRARSGRVNPADRASPATYPLYVGVRFRVRDVRRVWKANPLGMEQRRSKAVPEAKLKEAVAILMAELPPGERIIEEAGIARLQELTEGNREAGRAAWRLVPAEHKNKRGRQKAVDQPRG